MLKNNIQFQQHITCVLGLAVLEKQSTPYMISNKYTLYIKVVALDVIFNFEVLSLFIWSCLDVSKIDIKRDWYTAKTLY